MNAKFTIAIIATANAASIKSGADSEFYANYGTSGGLLKLEQTVREAEEEAARKAQELEGAEYVARELEAYNRIMQGLDRKYEDV